jgi:hypothetical protein
MLWPRPRRLIANTEFADRGLGSLVGPVNREAVRFGHSTEIASSMPWAACHEWCAAGVVPLFTLCRPR